MARSSSRNVRRWPRPCVRRVIKRARSSVPTCSTAGLGCADGFDHYDNRITRDPNAADRLEAERKGWDVIDAALAWLPSARSPYFVWIHLYNPPRAGPPRRPGTVGRAGGNPYNGDPAYADAQVGRLGADPGNSRPEHRHRHCRRSRRRAGRARRADTRDVGLRLRRCASRSSVRRGISPAVVEGPVWLTDFGPHAFAPGWSRARHRSWSCGCL